MAYPKLENRPWKVVKSENILHLGPWLSVRQECVELPSGKQIPTWYVMEFPDWINVIAITKDGKMVMEDQYRHALGETHYELVAGVIDPGETPLEAAKRELSEETGYEGGEWSLFMTLSPNPTNHNNLSYTFLATGVEKVREQHQEETEDIHVDILDPSQVLEMLQDGEMIQALHAAPLWRWFAINKENLFGTPLLSPHHAHTLTSARRPMIQLFLITSAKRPSDRPSRSIPSTSV